jgi:DNA-binding NarL/FixJ family response regulator
VAENKHYPSTHTKVISLWNNLRHCVLQHCVFLVIADDILARTGLVALLQDDEKLDIIGQMQPDTTLFDDIATYAPDVLLYDTGWSYDNDEDTLAELRRSILPMLVLSEAEHVEALRQQLFLEDVALSYVGILPRQSEGRAIEIALQAVARGLLVIDPASLTNCSCQPKATPKSASKV